MDTLLKLDAFLVRTMAKVSRFMEEWLYINRLGVNILLFAVFCRSITYNFHALALIVCIPFLILELFLWAHIIRNSLIGPDGPVNRLMGLFSSVAITLAMSWTEHRFDFQVAISVLCIVVMLYVNSSGSGGGKRRRIRESLRKLKEMFGDWVETLPAGAPA